jgi:LuxR family maltose regulon positive regulatory protein
MSRALRYAPPVAERGLIVRPRLLAQLRARFDRPVTAVVAAPGFGKTTLLAQAVRENALSPMGEDHWLTCQLDDSALSFLASGAYSAFGVQAEVPDDPRAAAVTVAEAMWSAAPTHVALILDDAHLVDAGSPGGQFLARLIEELPRNGHLVLGSRPPVPVQLSRLLASSEAAVLGERDLQFRGNEVTAFADSRGVPAELLNGVGGWPALAALTASVGPHAISGYVWEELLGLLAEDRRRALAILVAVGGADEEIAGALLGGRYAHLDTLLDGLPLVVRASNGWRSLHALWASALREQLDPADVARARRSAGSILARRRQYHDAMDLFLDAQAWDEVRQLVVQVCEVCTPLVPPDVLEVWLRRLPGEIRQSPEGLLLAAMVAEPVSPQLAEQRLEQALEAAPDAVPVRYACLNALVQLAFWRKDRRQMQVLADRLVDFADDGHPEASAWIALLAALLARDPGEVRRALAAPSLVSGVTLNPVQDWLHAHVVLLKLGDANAAEHLAARSLAHGVSTMRAVSRCALVESFRLRGQLDGMERLLPALLGDLDAPKILTSPELVTCAVGVLSVLSRHSESEALLIAFGPTIGASPVAWAAIAGSVAAAFHQASVGAESAAIDELAKILDLSVVQNEAVVQVSPLALPLLYVLVPQLRDGWDAAEPPGCFADVLRLAQALVDLRENASLRAVRALPVGVGALMAAVLPPPWSTELAVAMMAAGHQDGRGVLENLGPSARAVLRDRLAAEPGPIAATARGLLRELPPLPPFRLRLAVLGPLLLIRDGIAIAAPELRRERVRQLLAYLLTHDRPSRAAITADLWPDLDEGAASRNLRVTLAYLQNVFEPDRGELDAPYFVRSVGSSLQLVADDALEVDAVTFESSMDSAGQLERSGAPSAALAAYERSTDVWRGDYFADLPAADWLTWEQDRLRGRFVTAAVRAGNLVLARGDSAKARGLAERALAADEWSESAYQLLISAHLADGDRLSARRALLRCQEMLREFGVSAHQRTVALARQLALGAR